MSVYTELVKIGLQDAAATEIAEAVRRSAGVVTIADLDVRLARLDTTIAAVRTDIAQLEVRLQRTLITVMVALTGIFAFFVATMTWVLSR